MTQTHQRPFSIRTFVPDGDPDGLRIVEKSNWSGAGAVFKRTNYRQVVGRPEFDKTGVYVLVSSEGSSLPTIYVGEGDPVKDRINQHYSKKDFWSWAVFFISKDNSLNKALRSVPASGSPTRRSSIKGPTRALTISSGADSSNLGPLLKPFRRQKATCST